VRFTALWHHVYDVARLREAYLGLKRESAPGVDGVTWLRYGEALEENLRDLAGRLKRGAYRARPVRRVYIPKGEGRRRPIGVPALEDKIVQRATTEVLGAIYESDFLGFSYGFRPGRSQQNASWMRSRSASRPGRPRAGCSMQTFVGSSVLRCHRPRVADEVHRAPDCG
jgi:retron-type reverse transcriptase